MLSWRLSVVNYLSHRKSKTKKLRVNRINFRLDDELPNDLFPSNYSVHFDALFDNVSQLKFRVGTRYFFLWKNFSERIIILCEVVSTPRGAWRSTSPFRSDLSNNCLHLYWKSLENKINKTFYESRKCDSWACVRRKKRNLRPLTQARQHKIGNLELRVNWLL